MKNIIKYNKFLDKIVTYVPGKSETTKKKKGKIIKLSSNESPLEYSKKTSNLIKNIYLNFAKYPVPFEARPINLLNFAALIPIEDAADAISPAGSSASGSISSVL